MTGRFVDTNVFAYALDRRDPGKQDRAQEVIDTHRDDIVVSTQVLIELYAVCTRKLTMTADVARSAVEAVSAFPVIDTDRTLVLQGLQLSASAQLSIFDATIVCAAQRAGCHQILTEDLNDQQHLGSVKIVNPFVR